MKARLFTGLIAAVLLVALIYKGPVWLVGVVVTVLSALAYFEYDRLFYPVPNWFRLGRVSLYIAVTLYALSVSLEMWAVAAWTVFILHCVWHVTRANASSNLEENVSGFRVEFFGYLYCVALFGFLVPVIQMEPHGRDLVLLLFLIVSLGDTLAYFSGMFFGKHPLASKISPKKTVEGALGGTLGSIAIAVWWVHYVYKGDPTRELVLAVVGFALLGSVLAQFADLFESLLKRSQAVKDSGGLLPGHGGILDRTDGLALSAPAYFLYLKFILARLL
jgi:phosphatidate cytidylyltransferase